MGSCNSPLKVLMPLRKWPLCVMLMQMSFVMIFSDVLGTATTVVGFCVLTRRSLLYAYQDTRLRNPEGHNMNI